MKKGVHIALAAAAVFILALAVSFLPQQEHSTASLVPGIHVNAFLFSDKEGSELYPYITYIPKRALQTGDAPLILVFHAGKKSALETVHATNFNEVADKEGAIIAYPQAPNLFWGKKPASDANITIPDNNRIFLKPFIEMLSDTLPIDQTRIYATGASTGALYIQHLACEQGLFAAIAPVSGWIDKLSDCIPTPVLSWHEIPEEYAVLGQESWESSPWMLVNDCKDIESKMLTRPSSSITIGHKVGLDCAHGTDVITYLEYGGMHGWPTDSLPLSVDDGPPISFAALAWQFFSQYEH